MKLKIGLTIVVILLITGFSYLVVKTKSQSAQFVFQSPRQAQSGQTFTVPILISTSTGANAAELYFNFPADLLSVQNISKDSSIFQIWVKDSPGFDNSQGTIYLAGGSPTPGFRGSNLAIATITLTAKKAGNAKITLDAKSRLLANDEQSSPITASFEPKTIIIND